MSPRPAAAGHRHRPVESIARVRGILLYILKYSAPARVVAAGGRRVFTCLPSAAATAGCSRTRSRTEQCGRDGWVCYAVDTVKKGNLDGVFFDGFQGCSGDEGDHQVYRIKVYCATVS